MKKIKKIIVAVIALLVIVVVLAVVFIDHIAKAGTEAGATYALGTTTTLHTADIGIVSGRSRLLTLQVNNPSGFDTPHFLKLNNAAVAVSLGSLTGDTVEIPEFTLDGIDINIERKGASSNYQVILGNLKKFESKPEQQTQAETKEGKKFVIREILIRNVKARVKYSPLGGSLVDITVPVNEIRLRNVGTGSDKGVMIAELTDALLKSIMMAVAEQGGGLIPRDILGDLNASLASLAPLKDIGASLAVNVDGTVKELGGQAAKAAQAVTEQASKTVQATTQETSKAVQDAAKKAVGGATNPLDGLLKKTDENKPK